MQNVPIYGGKLFALFVILSSRTVTGSLSQCSRTSPWSGSGLHACLLLGNSAHDEEYLALKKTQDEIIFWASLQPSLEHEVNIFIHAMNMENSTAGALITEEILNDIQSSGLLDITSKIFMFSFGNIEPLRQLSSKYPKVVFVGDFAHNMRLFEFTTLLALQQLILRSKNPTNVLYLHSKGVTNTRDRFKMNWRRQMLRFAVRNFQTSLSLLKIGYKTSGIMFRDTPLPHYSGNFFWATSDHISQLRSLAEYNWHFRYGAEFWILSSGNTCKFFSPPSDCQVRQYCKITDVDVAMKSVQIKPPVC
eukprot:TRINITY_DN561_c0_g2_i5.p1 TRINITY_DN561_c0_g2~~TRINITY_DN561_c0_g2_i5.p1  ORF type:complete len:305 (-),score=39.12 TRINITY_DN561_c0_g2_i5:244-1158(-)